MNTAATLAILVEANTTAANASLLRTDANLRKTAATANASGAAMKKALLGVGAVAVGAGAALFEIGKQFDDAADTIRTKTGATGKELAKLEGTFKSVVSSVPTDFGTAADAVAGLNQRLDLTGRPLDRLAKQLAALSKLNGEDVTQSVAAVSRLFEDWSVKTKNQTKTLDRLFRLTQQTGIEFNDLSQLMVQWGSPLRSLGFSFDQAAAMLGNFEKSGVNMQTLLPGLRLMLGNIAQPTDELKARFKQLGISLKDPQAALIGVMDALRGMKDQSDVTALAAQVFGKRAGTDMARAILEGRFQLDDLIRSMRSGDETIRGTERSTRDFSEQLTLLKNRVMVALEPVATATFKAFSDGMKGLNELMKGRGGVAEAFQSVGNAVADFWRQSAVFRAAVNFIWDSTQRAWDAIKEIFRGGAKVIRGIVRVVSGVLTGNWGRAWDGVKDIFQGGIEGAIGIFKTMTAPIREIGAKIGGVLKDAFRDAAHAIARIFEWLKDKIVAIFDGVKNAITDALHWIQNAVNDALVALGIKDRIEITAPAGPLGPAGPNPPVGPGGPIGRQLGGVIPGPSIGDRIPLMAEGGEFMVNSQATKRFRPLLEAINGAVPRFASGGFVGMQPGIVRLAKSLLSKFGGVMSSGYRPGDDGFHGRGLAADIVPRDWAGAARYVNSIGPSLLEGIYTGAHGGPAVSWDSGHQVPSSFWGSDWAPHATHIHVAIAKMVKGIAAQIGRIKVSGHGPMAAIARASIDKVRQAANTYLSKRMPTASFDASSTGGQFSKTQLASLWRSTGGNGDPNLMAAIGMAESGGNPQAVSSAGARGLWQIMPFWGGGDRLFDPNYNARKAHAVLAEQGLGAWSAYTNGAYSQYLRKGGMVMPPFAGSFANGGIVPGPTGAPRTAIVHGGEPIGAPRVQVIVHGDVIAHRGHERDPVEVVISDPRFARQIDWAIDDYDAHKRQIARMH